jgi:hypothetical protein
LGRAIAQAVSRRLPTAAARVRFQVRSCVICGGQSGTGAGFLRVLRFPLPILIPPTTQHSSSSGAGTIGQILADVPSGLSLTPPQETKTKLDAPYFLCATFGPRIHNFPDSIRVIYFWRTLFHSCTSPNQDWHSFHRHVHQSSVIPDTLIDVHLSSTQVTNMATQKVYRQQHSSVLLSIFPPSFKLPSDSYNYSYTELSIVRKLHCFSHLITNIDHRSLFSYCAFYQTRHVRHVSGLFCLVAYLTTLSVSKL